MELQYPKVIHHLFAGNGGRGSSASSLSRFGLRAFTEPVVEFAVDHLQVAETTGSGGATTNGLLRPLNIK